MSLSLVYLSFILLYLSFISPLSLLYLFFISLFLNMRTPPLFPLRYIDPLIHSHHRRINPIIQHITDSTQYLATQRNATQNQVSAGNR